MAWGEYFERLWHWLDLCIVHIWGIRASIGCPNIALRFSGPSKTIVCHILVSSRDLPTCLLVLSSKRLLNQVCDIQLLRNSYLILAPHTVNIVLSY
jgi:hypothetical protein